MDHPSNGRKKGGKSRIPDHLRRRTLISCDRCKKRRIRCLRSSGSDAQEACQSCRENGLNCESTLPRKQRIYGSVETLSLRYRVLDALIKGLYPYEDTNNIEILYSIARAENIVLPNVNSPDAAEDAFNQPSLKERSQTREPDDSQSTVSPGSTEISAVEGSQVKVLEEKLVPTPHGPSHYIGPSSSFGFVLTVRNMVSEFNAGLRTSQPDDDRRRLQTDFAGSRTSKALEPRKHDRRDRVNGNLFQTIVTKPAVADRTSSLKAWSALLDGGTADGLDRLPVTDDSTLASFLPRKEMTDTLIEAFFELVHPNYVIFHHGTFQARYEATWTETRAIRDIDTGWICCVFMGLVFGAQALEVHDEKHYLRIQRRYLDLVLSRVAQLISTSSLLNIQALLLLQLYQHNASERNIAFMLLGCASRMAMALGMHREGSTGGFDSVEREERRRVWWTIYMFEQNQCMILGRPCAIDDMEVNVAFPKETKLESETCLPLGYIEHAVRLTRISSDIRKKIYAAPNSPTQQGESPRIGIANQLLLDLDSWRCSLPHSLQLERLSRVPKLRRATILLHIQYYHARALVTRPFILRKVGVQLARSLGKHVRSQDLDKEELELSHSCGTFARKSALLLQQVAREGMFDGVAWMDAYYVYHSVFLLSLDFLARPRDEKDDAEDTARKIAVRNLMDTLNDTNLCPTFTILTQVAWQLAKIVGIFDEPTLDFKDPGRFDEPRQSQYRTDQSISNGTDFKPQGPVEGIMNSWIQKEPVDTPWDLQNFFGTDSYIGVMKSCSNEPLIPDGPLSTYQPGLDENALIGDHQPNNNIYINWGGSFDGPFAQSSRYDYRYGNYRSDMTL